MMERAHGNWEVPLMNTRLGSPQYAERQAAYVHLDDFCSDEVRVEKIVEFGLLTTVLSTVSNGGTSDSELSTCLSLLERLCRHSICQGECGNPQFMSSLVRIIGRRDLSDQTRILAINVVAELLSFSTGTKSLVTVDLIKDCRDLISDPSLRDSGFHLTRSIILLSPDVSAEVMHAIHETITDPVLSLGPISDAQLDLLSALCDNVSVRAQISHTILTKWPMDSWSTWTVSGWKLMSSVTTDVATKIFFASKYLSVTISSFTSSSVSDASLPYILLVLLNLSEYPLSKSVMRLNTGFVNKLRELAQDHSTVVGKYSTELDRDLFFIP